MKNKHYDAVVFDMDHTLFDRYNTWRSVAYLLKANYKEWFNPDLCAAQIGDLLVKADQDYIYSGWREMFAKLNEWGMFSNPPSFEEYFETCLRQFRKIAIPIPLVNDMLLALRKQGYKVGIITNGAEVNQQPKIDMLHFTDVVDEILIGKKFGISKPRPEIFIEMSRLLDCKPERMLYVGDNPYYDVDASRNAGYTPIWVKTIRHDWHFEPEPAPYEINDVLELPELLETINNH